MSNKFLFFILILSSALSGAEGALTLDEVLSKVAKKNPSVLAARAEAERMRAMAVAAHAWMPPQVALEYMQAPDYDFSLWGMRRFEVSQELPFPGGTLLKGNHELQLARRERAMARGVEEAQYFEARKAFHELLGASHALFALEKANTALAEFEKTSKSRGSYGRLDRMGQFMDSMITAQAGEMEAMVPHWKNERRMAEGMLLRLMGEDPHGSLPDPQLSPKNSGPDELGSREVWKKAEASNPELQAARHERDRAVANRRLAWWGWLPKLMVEGGWEEDPAGMKFGTAKIAASVPYAWFWMQGGETAAANAGLRKAEGELEAATLMVKEEVRRQEGELKSALEELAIYEKKILPAVAKAIDQAVGGYKAGVLSPQEALMAVMAYWENHERYAHLIVHAGESRARVQQLIAEHSSESKE